MARVLLADHGVGAGRQRRASEDARGLAGLEGPGRFAACGARSGTSLSDLSVGGAPLEAESIGLCGARAIALAQDGTLFEADLAQGTGVTAVQQSTDS